MSGFTNDTKIEPLNTKFATSILCETITQLTLLQCADTIEQRRNDRMADATSADRKKLKKFAADVKNIKNTLYKIIADLERYHNFTDFSGVEVAENELNFLIEYSMNKGKFKEYSSVVLELEKEITNHRIPAATVDVSFFSKLLVYSKDAVFF